MDWCDKLELFGPISGMSGAKKSKLEWKNTILTIKHGDRPVFLWGCFAVAEVEILTVWRTSWILGSIMEVVLSKDPVLRYQVGTKKMKTSRYQVSLSPGGTEYPVDPVLAAWSESCQMRSLHKSTETGRHPKEEMHQTNNTLKTDTRIKWKSSSR